MEADTGRTQDAPEANVRNASGQRARDILREVGVTTDA